MIAPAPNGICAMEIPALLGDPERGHVGSRGLGADADFLAVEIFHAPRRRVRGNDQVPAGGAAEDLATNFSFTPLLTASATAGPK